MKLVILLFVSSLILAVASAQQPYLDSLKQRLNLAKNQDTARVLALFSLADYYGFIQEDSCLFYAAKIALWKIFRLLERLSWIELSGQLHYGTRRCAEHAKKSGGIKK